MTKATVKKKPLSKAQKKAINAIKHCKACGQGFRDIGALMKHIRAKHPHYPRKG